jgi:MscS family membrane protein
MRVWKHLSLLVALWALIAGVAHAQFPIPTPPTPEAVVPESLQSPRATIRTLLEAAEENDGQRARAALDLETIPLTLRDTEGARRALQLAYILDRTRKIDFAKIPDRKEGEPYVFASYTDPENRQPLGEVVVERQQDGAWRFSPETVELIPTLYRATQDLPSRSRLSLNGLDLRDPGEVGRALAPIEWRRPFLILEIWQWVGLGSLLVLSALLVPILRRIIKALVRLRIPFIRENVTNVSENRLKASVVGLVLAELWRSVLPYFDLATPVEASTVFVLRILAAGATAWLLSSLFDALVDVAGQVGQGFGRRAEHILIPVVRKFGKTIIIIGTALFVASALDFNLAGVIAGLGIGGLVIALAAKDSVENLFGSLTILFDMPFGVGDWVKIGDVDGVVEEINLRSTRIRTFADSVITLPNSNLIKASVENMGRRRYRRVLTLLGLEYDTPPDRVDKFCREVRELLENHPKTKKDTLRVSFLDYGANSLDIQLYTYFDTESYDEELELRHGLMLDILRIANRIGVSFAFPTRTVVLKRSDEEALRESQS